MKRTIAMWAALVCGAGAAAQQPLQNRKCTVEPPVAASEADKTLAAGQPEEAESLYLAMAPGPAATAGVVRAELSERKLDEALARVQKELAATPDNALLLDLLGEVRYRRGEPGEAAAAFTRSAALDPCAARTHYDIFRYLKLNGMYASAQRELDLAHRLSPLNPVILRVWRPTQEEPLTASEEIAQLKQRESSDPKLSDEQKLGIENAIKAVTAQEKGDCRLATPVTSTKIPLLPVNNTGYHVTGATQSNINVLLNGKRRSFLLDTGASGLLLSRGAARALGLTPEVEVLSYGIGDGGMKSTFVAHVDDVRIGGMEFHNCMVRVLEADTLKDVDGLLGPDMFANFMVTLDFPENELRLGPLPARPGDAQGAAALDTSGGGGRGAANEGPPAATQHDRYIAPGMESWERVFRSGHDLIVSASIGKAPVKLFILDTGASGSLIPKEAAREVTGVGRDTDVTLKGVSGEVKQVYSTDAMSITFAHVKQEMLDGVTAIDTSSFSAGDGVEISGFFGYPTLRQLVLEIDYRDNLVHVSYTPHLRQ